MKENQTALAMDSTTWQDVGDNSIGKVQQWNGNAGAVVRAWAFYRRYGRDLEDERARRP